ncbi:hypothetical protein [Nonomuraea salmonea]|uniref:hypothetical protein n=1 Tax=Nonomuraea salmonea TaxID=46181 RepID=UPI0031EC809B
MLLDQVGRLQHAHDGAGARDRQAEERGDRRQADARSWGAAQQAEGARRDRGQRAIGGGEHRANAGVSCVQGVEPVGLLFELLGQHRERELGVRRRP